MKIEAVSKLYASPAWPDPSQPAFVNAVAAIRTDLPPRALLEAIHAIEAGFGRRRRAKNAPRSLDMDILAYDDRVCGAAAGDLVLPHPGVAERDFVLAPLCDIAPAWRHPVTGKTASAMLAALQTVSAVALGDPRKASVTGTKFFAPQQL